MRKLITALVALSLSGCVVIPDEPTGYTRVIEVDPVCCVWYRGFSGFWYGGRFYDQYEWNYGFRGGVPYRYEGNPRWEGRGERRENRREERHEDHRR